MTLNNATFSSKIDGAVDIIYKPTLTPAVTVRVSPVASTAALTGTLRTIILITGADTEDKEELHCNFIDFQPNVVLDAAHSPYSLSVTTGNQLRVKDQAGTVVATLPLIKTK